MQGFFLLVVATCPFDLVHADRSVAGEDEVSKYESTSSTSTSSKSLQISLSFMITWLEVVLLLGLLVFLVEKMILYCHGVLLKRSSYKLVRRSSNASFSLGSVSYLCSGLNVFMLSMSRG